MQYKFFTNIETTTKYTNYAGSGVQTNNTVTFMAKGFGTSAWSATVKICPMILDSIDTSSPISLTISNTSPTASTTIQTGVKNYVAKIDTLVGICFISSGFEV